MSLAREEDVEAEESSDSHHQETQSLLTDESDSRESHRSRPTPPRPQHTPQRQTSVSKRNLNGIPATPRTPNRVRFNVPELSESNEEIELQQESGQRRSTDWIDDEHHFTRASGDHRGSSTGQRAPLLTGIEAPSVVVATETFDGSAEYEDGRARPKSGVRGAFMNMANSIM